MKKKIILSAVMAAAVIGGAFFYLYGASDRQHMLAAESNFRPAEVIPGEQGGKKGVTFVMDLCVPMEKPLKCEVRKYGLFVPYGKEAVGMPYVQRPVDIETVDGARVEAEARADMVENVRHDDTASN